MNNEITRIRNIWLYNHSSGWKKERKNCHHNIMEGNKNARTEIKLSKDILLHKEVRLEIRFCSCCEFNCQRKKDWLYDRSNGAEKSNVRSYKFVITVIPLRSFPPPFATLPTTATLCMLRNYALGVPSTGCETKGWFFRERLLERNVITEPTVTAAQ